MALIAPRSSLAVTIKDSSSLVCSASLLLPPAMVLKASNMHRSRTRIEFLVGQIEEHPTYRPNLRVGAVAAHRCNGRHAETATF